MPPGGEPSGGSIVVGEDRHHTRHGQSSRPVDPQDAGMGMRRAQDLEMKQVRYGQIEGEGCAARDDPRPGRGRDAAPARVVAPILRPFHARYARHGVGDGAVAGTATQITLQGGGEIADLPLVQGRCGHDHAGVQNPHW